MFRPIGGPHPYSCICSTCKFTRRSSSFELGDLLEKQEVFPYHGSLEMAGTKREDISVKLKGENLIVTYVDRYGEKITIPSILSSKIYDQNKLECVYENGLLTITCPVKTPSPRSPLEPEIDIEIK